MDLLVLQSSPSNQRLAPSTVRGLDLLVKAAHARRGSPPPSSCGRGVAAGAYFPPVFLVFAVLSTLSIGLGEFVASGVTRRTRANEVTTTMFFSGIVLTAALAIVWPGDPTISDLVYGAVAGATNGVGILLLYIAYSRGSLRSAAPAAAVVMSAVPVLWDVIVSGVTPSTVTSIGLGLGVGAIALSSYERNESPAARDGLLTAIVAGTVFGVLLVLLSYIGKDAGGSPILVQRIVGFLLAAAVTRATGPRVFPAVRRDLVASIGVGLLGTSAVIFFMLALRSGSLSVVSVVSSQYAAVAVVFGVVFYGQRMWWWQAVGLAGASVSVALIAIG